MKRAIIAVLAASALAGCQSSARMRWERIGPGPEFVQAEARCNIMAMGVGTSTVAVGSPGYVAGAMIGGAIATGIQQEQFKQNCMVLQGWKKVPDVKGSSATMPAATPATYSAPKDAGPFPPPPRL